MLNLENLPLYLTYDDVLILPNLSDVGSKDASVKTKISKHVEIEIPIISSPMDTVTEQEMAEVLAKEGGMGILHRNLSIESEVKMVENVKKQNLKIGAAIGPFDGERAKALDKAGADVILIDVADGLKPDIIASAKAIKKSIKADLICGSIATEEGAKAYAQFADGLRVGIGPGSICTMRIVTGVGVPQLTAVNEVYKIAKNFNVPVMADGGIRYSGDMAKAIAVGADTIMLGNLLAGAKESPGEVIEVEGKKYKSYRGMGSRDALESGPVADRYEQEKIKKKISMGVAGLLMYKGTAGEIVYQLIGGLKASMGLIGAWNLEEMKQKARLIRITSAGSQESHPHTLASFKPEENYGK